MNSFLRFQSLNEKKEVRTSHVIDTSRSCTLWFIDDSRISRRWNEFTKGNNCREFQQRGRPTINTCATNTIESGRFISRIANILRERLLHRVVLSQDGCDRCWFHETLDNKNLTEHFPLRFETPLSIQFSYEFLYDDRNEKGKIVRTRTSVDTCAALRFPFLYSTIIVRSDAVDSTVAAYLKWSSGGISDLEWIISRGKWWREVSQRSDALV